MFFLRLLAGVSSALAAVLIAATAWAADLQALVTNLTTGGFGDRETAIGGAGRPRARRAPRPSSRRWRQASSIVRKADNVVVIGKRRRQPARRSTRSRVRQAGRQRHARPSSTASRVNNRLRGVIEAAVGSLTLMSPDARVRRGAADSLFKRPDPAALGALDAAIAAEKDARIKTAFQEARAAVVLTSDASKQDKLAALERRARQGQSRCAERRCRRPSTAPSDPEVKAAATTAAASVRQYAGRAGRPRRTSGTAFPLGSVLLLAAIGLAITFGTMGVINMAHGEMVMLGASTTFVVQDIIRTSFPHLFDASLLIALPLRLPGRRRRRHRDRARHHPLPLRPAARHAARHLGPVAGTAAGRALDLRPVNREVGAPSFMSGAFQVGQITVTYGRLWIVVFSLLVFVTLILVLRKTPLGLYMRAVTQNRPMASAMGIRTRASTR